MHRPRRTPFTTTAISSQDHCSQEFSRVAHELFTLMGRPDKNVQLDPTLDADDELPCRVEHILYPESGIRIFLPLGSPRNTDEVWSTLAFEVALASDDWFVKSAVARIAVVVCAVACASRVASLARLSTAPRFAAQASAVLATGLVSSEAAHRYAHYRADRLVVDALARAGLDGPLCTYLSSVRRGAIGHTGPWHALPSPTGYGRFKRVRKHLDRVWGINAVALVSGTSP
ncbi:hypothetical protein pkur_cds_740 [Pandoravirus kuranda]|uniref:Uncharacterized protein n=1 Tax=Pandoravirus kuranda TaxID=3019033 RepID=A0AA95EED1_9VIRU|nr:hypothetical protein pkur_cds_740 [Pandoravirus kuranda]